MSKCIYKTVSQLNILSYNKWRKTHIFWNLLLRRKLLLFTIIVIITNKMNIHILVLYFTENIFYSIIYLLNITNNTTAFLHSISAKIISMSATWTFQTRYPSTRSTSILSLMPLQIVPNKCQISIQSKEAYVTRFLSV